MSFNEKYRNCLPANVWRLSIRAPPPPTSAIRRSSRWRESHLTSGSKYIAGGSREPQDGIVLRSRSERRRGAVHPVPLSHPLSKSRDLGAVSSQPGDLLP